MKRRLFLLSNSTPHDGAYLAHAVGALPELLGPRRRVLFVPFALKDQEGYWRKVRAALEPAGFEVTRMPEDDSAPGLVSEAEAVFVGGGNTFRLLARMHATGALGAVRERAADGMPYIGSSAGTVIAAPTLGTTNDMPIMSPASFEALGLVPFNINCHYLDPDPGSTHMGESRDDRIIEFLEENAGPVLAMREGAWLRADGGTARLEGSAGARIFRRERGVEELSGGTDLSHLLG